LIKTELDTIQFNKANVALVPQTGNTKQPFKIAQVNGSGQLLDQNQLIVFTQWSTSHWGTIEIKRVTLQSTTD